MLRTLAENPSLKEISLILPPPSPGMSLDHTMRYQYMDPRPRDLIVFKPQSSFVDPANHSTNLFAKSPPNVSSPNVSSPSNPLFVPMAHVDDNVRDTIWDCILRFALGVDVYKNGTERMNREQIYQLICTRDSIPRVSMDFKVI